MKPAAPRPGDFEFPPAVGTIALYRGQRYEAVGVASSEAPDSSDFPQILWRSHCARCGDVMEVLSRLSSRYITRRCGECKQPGARV
jgi:RNase P/RNase MRP subunit POP5